MKTPEEIKKGLRFCHDADSEDIGKCKLVCPYYGDGQFPCGITTMMKDALAYIEQLEERIDLNALRDAIYQDAVAHGLWESTDYTARVITDDLERHAEPIDADTLMRELAVDVIWMEVNELDHACEDEEEYTEELADVIIAALSVAGKLGIDIDAAVRSKMEINKGRPWKHGKEE